MSSRSLGVLTLDLIAKIGGFEAGLGKAEKEAQKRAAAIERAFDNAFTGITAGFAVVAAAGVAALAAINAQAETIASFQDLSDKIGDSAEAIAALQLAATVSGTSIDEVAAASVRLTAALSKTDDESKGVGIALKSIGLEFDAFKKLSPVEQLEAVAKALNQFEDGAGKTAVATALFGKAGADLLKFLKDLGEQGGRTIGLTDAQIAASDQYTKATARLKAEFNLFIQQQSSQFIPVLAQVQSLLAEVAKNETVVEAITTVLNVAIKGAIVVFQALAVIGSDVAFVLLGVGREIGAIIAQVGALARMDMQGFNAISEAVKADGARARTELDAFQKRVMAIGQPVYMDDEVRRLMGRSNAQQNPGKPTLRPPPLSGGGGGGVAKDDPTKKLLDNQLKELSNFIDAEKDLMASRQKFLDLFNSQGIVSVHDYYDQQRAILNEATQNQVKAYDQQIEALRKYQASASKATDRAEAEGKINDLIAKQAKLQRDSGASAIEMGIKQEQAIKAYRAQLDEVNAKILELNGSLGAAAAIRFDASNKQLRALAEASGDVASVEQIDRLRQYSIAQADINKLQQDFSLIQGDLQIAEERITIARERGTIGELESLRASGDARKAAVGLLQEQLAAYEKIDKSVRTKEQEQAINRLKVQLEGLQATVDPLADKFNTLFEGSLGNAFGDFINGTKSAKDAFKDFASSVTNEIGQLVGKQLAKQLFNSIFESSGSSGGASGFNIGGFFASIFGGGRAAGGPVLPNTLYRVNERGPEMFEAANGNQFLMTGSTGGRVHPNGSGGGLTQNISFPVQGRVDRRTVAQAAAELRRQTNTAAVRFE